MGSRQTASQPGSDIPGPESTLLEDREPTLTETRAGEPESLHADGAPPSAIQAGLRRWLSGSSLVPGLTTAAAVTAVAVPLGILLPVVGGPVIAIVVGVTVAIVRPPGESWQPGLRFASTRVLQWSIVVLGTGISLQQVVHIGTSTLPVLAGTLLVALVVTLVLSRVVPARVHTATLSGLPE